MSDEGVSLSKMHFVSYISLTFKNFLFFTLVISLVLVKSSITEFNDNV